MRYLFVLFMFAATALGAQDCVIEVNTAGGDVYVGTSQIKYAVENGGTAVVVRQGRASRVQSTNTVDVLVSRCNSSLFKFTDSRSGRTYAISKSYILTALEATDATLILVTTDPGVSFKTVESAASLSALLVACGDDIVWPENSTYYVSTGGNNSTAITADRSKPWLDPWSAWDSLAASSPTEEHTIQVAPGTYTFSGPWGSDNDAALTQARFNQPVLFYGPNASIIYSGVNGSTRFVSDVNADFSGTSPIDVSFNLKELSQIDKTGSLVTAFGVYDTLTRVTGYVGKLRSTQGRSWGIQSGAGLLDLKIDTLIYTGGIMASFTSSNGVVDHNARYFKLDLGYVSAPSATSDLDGAIRIQETEGKNGTWSNQFLDIDIEEFDVGASTLRSILFYYMRDSDMNTADINVKVDHLNNTTGVAMYQPIGSDFGAFVLRSRNDYGSKINISVGKTSGEIGYIFNMNPTSANFVQAELNLDLGYEGLVQGDINIRDQLDSSIINIKCADCDSQIAFNSLQADGSKIYISGYFHQAGSVPVIDLDNLEATAYVLLEDLKVENDGAVAAIQSTLARTVYVRGAFDMNTIILDPDITYVRLDEYGGLSGADGYVSDDLASGTAAYSVLTGDFILNFGANIDMQYNDVRFFDVTPRANSGGQDFFFRAGSTAFHQDVYQDGVGSGYVEMLSPGGSIVMRDAGTGVTLGLPAGGTSNFIISDARTVKTGSPLIFDADYSANYTARSVVDKAYVDGVAGDGNGLISELPTATQTINGGANNLTINTANTALNTTASGGFTGPGGAVNDVTFVTVASSGATIGYTDDSEVKTMSVVIDQSSVAIGETAASVNVDVDGYFSKVQLASIPVTVPAEGKMFYNSADDCTYISDGTDWKLHSGEQIASVHMAGGTNTSITAATAEQLNLTTSGTVTTLIADSQFTVQADGDIQYTGNNNAQLEISVSISTSTSTATDMYYYLAINGTVQAGSRQRRDHANNDYGNIGLHFLDSDADLNDVYSIYAEPVSGTVSITTSDAIIIVERTN